MHTKVSPDTNLTERCHVLDKYLSLTNKYSDPIVVAAAHIEDAKKGRGEFGKSYAMSKTCTVRLAYNLLFSVYWNYFIMLIIAGHCILLIESRNCFTFCIIEGIFLLVYIIDMTFIIVFITPKTLFASRNVLKSKFQFLLLLFFIIDFTIRVYSHVSTGKTCIEHIVIPFQCSRILMVIIKIKSVNHVFMVVFKTFTRIMWTLLAIILFIIFFACIGIHIFAEIYHAPKTNSSSEGRGTKYDGQFDYFITAFIRLFVLLTTENYPDIMIPAYQHNKVTMIYFVLYIYFGMFILLSILLAIVVDNYWTIAKMNVKSERLKGRKLLAMAWNLLGDGEDKLSVYDENILSVFKMLKPHNDDEELIILLQQLTNDKNKSIIEYKSWLTKVIDILDLEIERPSSTNTNLMTGLIKKKGGNVIIFMTLTIQSAFIQRTVLILLYFHTALFVVYRYNPNKHDHISLEFIIQCIRSLISAVFLIEITIRTCVMGYVHCVLNVGVYSRRDITHGLKKISAVDVIDVILVLGGCTANGMWFYANFVDSYLLKGTCVVVSSIIFIIRLLVNSAQANKAYVLLRQFVPVMSDLTCVLMITIYVFAALGETLFLPFEIKEKTAGNLSNPDPYGCGLGFTNFGCSLITIFQITTTSNWHEILQRLIQSSAGLPSAIYFIVIYVLLHMVIINLFVATAYEAYMKLVVNPRQSKAPPKTTTNNGKSLRKRFTHVLSLGTKGNRKSIKASPRPHLRNSVILKRKSMHRRLKNISDSSIGEHLIPPRKDSDTNEDDEAMLSTLPREKRQELILKKRMQKRAEAKGRARRLRNPLDKPSFADVVKEYSAKTDTEISLSPGQKIKVLEKSGTLLRGTIIEGPDAGKNGWFPAFVVKSIISEMNRISYNNKPSTPIKSETQPKFVKKQHADWTKDIIGPMTIMNPEELRELNKILKANSRGGRGSSDGAVMMNNNTSSLSNKPRTRSLGAVPLYSRPDFKKGVSSLQIMNSVVEEDEMEEDDNVFNETSQLYPVPEVVIEQPSIAESDDDDDSSDNHHLQSPTVKVKEFRNKDKWKKTSVVRPTKPAEMPDWAKKFLTESNAKIADAASIKSPTESETSDPLGKALSDGMGTNTPEPKSIILNNDITATSPVTENSRSNDIIINVPEPPKKRKSIDMKRKLPWNRSASKEKDLVTINKQQSDSALLHAKLDESSVARTSVVHAKIVKVKSSPSLNDAVSDIVTLEDFS